jgi:hypothetical protein
VQIRSKRLECCPWYLVHGYTKHRTLSVKFIAFPALESSCGVSIRTKFITIATQISNHECVFETLPTLS